MERESWSNRGKSKQLETNKKDASKQELLKMGRERLERVERAERWCPSQVWHKHASIGDVILNNEWKPVA